MAFGRPSKYDDKFRETFAAYVEDCTQFGDLFPSVAGAAVACNVGRQTIYDWAKQDDKDDFSYMLERLLAKQEQDCSGKGMSGEYNATIAKLVLAKHGYSDKVEQDTTLKGDQNNPIAVTEVKFNIVDP